MKEPTVSKGTVQVVYTNPPLIVPNPPFVIQPATLMLEKMCETYEVTFSLLTNIPGAKLVGLVQPVPDPPPGTVVKELPDGGLVVTFNHPDDQGVTNTYHYAVTVHLPNGVTITSPDPEIEIPHGP
jgi:hypothetical protein